MNAAGALAVGVGAALGVGLNAVLPQLPLGTLAANLIGGYLIGFVMMLLAPRSPLFP